jgi:hypothetical protein
MESGPSNLAGERIRIVTDKIIGLQKEIDIEFKIKEGLEKIVKLKGIVMKNKKKPLADATICMQLNKSVEKLEVLNNEMLKRKSQLQHIEDMENDISVNNGDGELIQVVAEDESRKSATKISIFITNDQSTYEVIETIIKTMSLPTVPSNYSLFCTDMDESILI